MHLVIYSYGKRSNQQRIIFEHAVQRQLLSEVFSFKNQSMKYFAYLGTYFSTAHTEPLKTLFQQLS